MSQGEYDASKLWSWDKSAMSWDGMAKMTRLAVWVCALAMVTGAAGMVRAQPMTQQTGSSQTAMSTQAAGVGHRTRLILKDGSYQIVMSYQVKGKIVSYERRARRDRGDSDGPCGLGRDAPVGAAASGDGERCGAGAG